MLDPSLDLTDIDDTHLYRSHAAAPFTPNPLQ